MLSTTSGIGITIQGGAMLYVAGGLQNSTGSTLTNGGTVQLTGDLTNAGTLTSPGMLLFSGTTDQAFSPGAATVGSLTLRNTGAVTANRLLLLQDLMVSGTLTLVQGLVRTQGLAPGSPLVTLSLPDGGRVVGEAAGQYVQGRLAVMRIALNASTGSVDFTNGMVINPNGQDIGPVTVTRTAGLQTGGVSYGQNVGGTAKGIDRTWQVVAAQQPSAVAPISLTVSWVSDDDNGFDPTQPTQLWRADQANGPWASQGAPASASARSFTANAAQLGVLTVSNTSQPLPVTLVTFMAQRQGNDGLLQWITASELRNAYFEVESAPDGIAFRPVGRLAGQGRSSQAHAYQFVDANLTRYAVAQVYYRLRQVDVDGTSTYSPIRTVQVPRAANLLVQAYPNPSALRQDVALALCTDQVGPATLSLLDVLGHQLSQYKVTLSTGTTTWSLPESSQLATGVYILRIQQGVHQQSVKIVRH
ncbi:T9SS type A sorting domain-containing protein (plasmid) [Hymenobacter sp. BRD128]|uniref:T9SS type A sorting domain-containing protein n=1 Tax=Hymenobacter sp. BRD128 TaxID=2675878 RepID=UPI0015632352|nr:T9SS type A sorting domain-containing protein [Hymenobacter sp. BRD128]QKG59200.1 T9SS type A sorting domain-containing protein [Hymenobacter sp. BRD128]